MAAPDPDHERPRVVRVSRVLQAHAAGRLVPMRVRCGWGRSLVSCPFCWCRGSRWARRSTPWGQWGIVFVVVLVVPPRYCLVPLSLQDAQMKTYNPWGAAKLGPIQGHKAALRGV
jgi:hypothetical protein